MFVCVCVCDIHGLCYISAARDVSKGEAAVEELKKDGLSPLFHQLDVTSTESIKTCHDFLVNKYGSIDVLVNNAGVDCDVSFLECVPHHNM